MGHSSLMVGHGMQQNTRPRLRWTAPASTATLTCGNGGRQVAIRPGSLGVWVQLHHTLRQAGNAQHAAACCRSIIAALAAGAGLAAAARLGCWLAGGGAAAFALLAAAALLPLLATHVPIVVIIRPCCRRPLASALRRRSALAACSSCRRGSPLLPARSPLLMGFVSCLACRLQQLFPDAVKHGGSHDTGGSQHPRLPRCAARHCLAARQQGGCVWQGQDGGHVGQHVAPAARRQRLLNCCFHLNEASAWGGVDERGMGESRHGVGLCRTACWCSSRPRQTRPSKGLAVYAQT